MSLPPTLGAAALTGQGMGALGQVLQQQGAVFPEHWKPISHCKPPAWVWDRLPQGVSVQAPPCPGWTARLCQAKAQRESGSMGQQAVCLCFSLQAWTEPSWLWGPVRKTHAPSPSACGQASCWAGAAFSAQPHVSLASLDLQWKLTLICRIWFKTYRIFN